VQPIIVASLDRSVLIAVEGIDGAGKTTQVRLLRDALQSAGAHIHLIDGMMSREAVHREMLGILTESALKRKLCAKSYGCDNPFECSFLQTGTCDWFRVAKSLRPTSLSLPA
jgi:ABC-type branched-subunit amino acid transport system ATPase component